MSNTTKQSRELTTMKSSLFALAGISLLLLTETLKQDKLDGALTIAFYCFVVSMPLLVGFAICIDAFQSKGFQSIPDSLINIFMGQWISAYIAVAGITSYLWHFSVTAAIVFLVSIFVAIGMFIAFQHAIDRSNKNEDKKDIDN